MPPRAFTLIEATMSIVVVSIMLVSALRVLGTARAGEVTAMRRSVAHALAQDLMSEIVLQDYQDADEGDSLGPGAGELDRTAFDDVDDYSGWSAQPPQDADGAVLTDFAGYTRSVEVVWVDPDDLSLTRASATGIKRIIVTVAYDDREHARLIAFRSDAHTPGPEGSP